MCLCYRSVTTSPELEYTNSAPCEEHLRVVVTVHLCVNKTCEISDPLCPKARMHHRCEKNGILHRFLSLHLKIYEHINVNIVSKACPTAQAEAEEALHYAI